MNKLAKNIFVKKHSLDNAEQIFCLGFAKSLVCGRDK